MINEFIVLQNLLLISLIFFINTINILTLWYLAGIYLIFLGVLILVDDGGIFIGFLWVIDLGVGLIFFIFILHFSNFLHQKAIFDLTNKFFFYFTLFCFFFIFFLFLSTPINININLTLQKSWFFFISWYDYYNIYNVRTITDLNLLREIYFYLNSFEFFTINFVVFYGIISAIIFTFLSKKFFSYLNFSQLINLNLYSHINTNLFIRNQNFIKQQNTSTGTRVWLKSKNFKL